MAGDLSPWQPSLDAWLTQIQETGSAYLAIEVSTDLTDVIDSTRDHLWAKLGIAPEDISVTIVGSNALLLKHKSFEPPDPFED